MACSSKDTTQTRNNCNSRKRKLEDVDFNEQALAKSLFEPHQPPTKKQRLSQQQWEQSIHDRYNRDKHMNITWENRVVLSKKCVNTIYNKICSLLSTKQYGFKRLDAATYDTFIHTQIKNQFSTIHGIQLTDLTQPIVNTLVRSLRAYYIQLKTMHAPHKVTQIFDSKKFKKAFAFDVIANGKTLSDRHKERWIQMCDSHSVPPYTLIQHWFKQNKILSKNKDVNEWIKRIQLHKNSKAPHAIKAHRHKMRKLMHNESFPDFCLCISLVDSCSFHYETERANKSIEFETLMYDKVNAMVQGLNAKYDQCITMATEEEQRVNQGALTPDMLLSQGIWINHQKVHWIDVKNYFVTDKGFLWKKVKKQCAKYTNAFGTGAVICRGFQHGLKTPCSVLWLDGYHLIELDA